MAEITFVISTEHKARLVDAICGLRNYTEPTGRGDFALGYLKKFMRNQVHDWESLQAQLAAQSTITEIEIS